MGRFMGRIMARGINRLSGRAVETATNSGLIADGGGLYLQVSKSGAKSWLYKFMLNGHSREMGLVTHDVERLVLQCKGVYSHTRLIVQGR